MTDRVPIPFKIKNIRKVKQPWNNNKEVTVHDVEGDSLVLMTESQALESGVCSGSAYDPRLLMVGSVGRKEGTGFLVIPKSEEVKVVWSEKCHSWVLEGR